MPIRIPFRENDADPTGSSTLPHIIYFMFQVVGSSLGSLDLAGSEQTIYETPYSLLDNISPAYRCHPLPGTGTLYKGNRFSY